MRIGLHGEGDAFAGQVHLGHGHPDLLTYLHDLGRILHKAISQLTDMDQAILVHTDIHKGSEGGDVGHDARQFHARLEVFEFFDPFLESEDLEALARIPSGLGQLVEDVLEGRQAHLVGDVLFRTDLAAKPTVTDEIAHGAPEITGHGIDQFVALRMNRAGIQRVPGLMDSEESGALLEGLRTQSGHFQQFFARADWPVFVAVADDVGGQRRAQARHITEQLLAGSIELHAHAVHARDDHVIQTALKGIGIHIVLVLTHTDGLRIELHQFSQRIHQPTPDAHRTPDRDIFAGKLLTGDLAGRVNRGAALVDQHHGNARRQVQ